MENGNLSAVPSASIPSMRQWVEPPCCPKASSQLSGYQGLLCWCETGHPRGPTSKPTRCGLGSIAEVNLEECQRLLPQGLAACTALSQWLLVESNWSRCYINIYHSSVKQHLIWECEMPHTKTFPWARVCSGLLFSPGLALPENWRLDFPVN